MNQYYAFDQLAKMIPKICREQRHFLRLSQKNVVEKLEEEKGIIIDQSKISMFESGKIRIPDFLSDYCSILDIYFPAPSYRKEYLMKGNNITRKTILEEIKYIKEVVEDIIDDMWQYNIADCEDIDICSVGEYYCAKASIPVVCEDEIPYLSNNFIFAFRADSDGPKLCGRMQIHSVLSTAYINSGMDNEILLFTDGESADLGKMALYMHNMMRKHIKKLTNQSCDNISNDLGLISDEFFIRLLEHSVLLIGDIYVYETDRKKGCFTSMMKYLWQWFGQDSTWICNTSPVYLKEYEYEGMDVDYDYPEEADADVQSVVDTNIKIFEKFGDVEIVSLDNMTSGEFPYIVHKGNF